ncbi:MAG: hypothetical protein QOC59_780 [Microbacteriaceae bacterium]|nr:hypothetical protein [Microbacteriaceae bacterium]
MSDVREDADRLASAIARFGLNRLVGEPDLCRNVLGDLFPGDPLTAPLLAAAAAERVPTRLVAERDRVDAAVVIPQLAHALAAARGLRDDYAERAVRTWAAALGLDANAGATTGAPEDRTPADATWVRPVPEARTPEAPAPLGGSAPTKPDYPPPPTTPAESSRRRRPRPVLLIAAGAVVLLVLTGAGIAVWRIASASAGAPGVTVRAVDGGAGTITAAATTKAVRGTATLDAGQTVTASKGPIEVSDADGAVLRLDSGAQLVYLSAATEKAIAQFELVTGRAYVNASGGRKVGVQSPAGHAEVGAGRLAVSCAGASCTFQALEERQDVHMRQGRMVSLEPHQRVIASAAAGSAGTAETAVYAAPDALRGDPWLATNIRLDGRQHRAGAAIAGRKVVGEWVFGYDSRYSGVVNHPVDIRANCTPTGCALVAESSYATCPSSKPSCPMTGPVTVQDRAGSSLRIAYPRVEADCTGDHKSDGSQVFTDVLTVSSGTGGSGTRHADLTPKAGSGCSKLESAFQHQTLPISATHAPLAATAVPQPGDEEQLYVRYVNKTRRCTHAPKRGSAIADLVCTYPSDKDDGGRVRPKRVEFALFRSAADQAAAYQQLAARAHLHNTGSCATGTCERPFDGVAGRKLQFGAAGNIQLTAYEPDSGRLLLIATGGRSAAQMSTWYQKTDDFTVRPFYVAGF